MSTLLALVSAVALLLLGWGLIDALRAGTATEGVAAFEPWCAGGCTCLVEWNDLVSDPKLNQALCLAYHYAPPFRGIAQVSVKQQTRVVAKPIPAERKALAYYAIGANTIVVDTALLTLPIDSLAPLLAHEVAHAASLGGFRQLKMVLWWTPWGPARCYAEEFRAASWASFVYLQLPPGGEWTWLRDRFHEQATLWQEGRLGDAVLVDWQEQCLGADWTT